MVVELPLVLAVTVNLRHRFQALEHGLHEFLVRCIDHTPSLVPICANELRLNPCDVDWEVLDELGNARPFLIRDPRLLDCLDLVTLFLAVSNHATGYEQL